jgi:hypothetical protein
MEYFGDAAVVTDNTSAAIRESVLSAFAHRDELAQSAAAWVERNRSYMDERIAGLRTLLTAPTHVAADAAKSLSSNEAG